jgi:hypothetical protein
LNPIEEAFSAIKAFLRRNEGHALDEEQREWLIHEAIMAITTDDIEGWFSDSGYMDRENY